MKIRVCININLVTTFNCIAKYRPQNIHPPPQARKATVPLMTTPMGVVKLFSMIIIIMKTKMHYLTISTI
jgi:hypothetical protein